MARGACRVRTAVSAMRNRFCMYQYMYRSGRWWVGGMGGWDRVGGGTMMNHGRYRSGVDRVDG